MYDSFTLDKAILASNFNAEKLCRTNPQLSIETVTRRIDKLKTYQKKLKKLLKIPIIEQKSELWYKTRENMISASDFAQALGQGKFGTAKQLIQKKCEPVNESAFSQTNPFFKWGNMFEPVAIDIYSDLSGVKVHAFGLIKHPKYDFFGASPDGIDELGRMVEIKCPMKRTIVKGKIPTQYEYQMQGQLDVCDLDECYYFECTFGTVDNINEFNSIYKNYEYVGVIIEYEQCKYCYSGVYHSSDISVIQSINKFTDSNSKGVYHYWFLKEYNMEKVVRDPVFIKEKMKDLRVVWDKIMYYRQNKEQYVVDILNTIDIETESLYQLKENDKPKLKGYSLKDLE